MKSLQPVNGNIVLKVKEEKEETTTTSGIYIPDSAKEKNNLAEVTAIAEGIKEFSVGDVVMYKDFSGVQSELDGEKYIVMPATEVVAKIVEVDKIPD